MSKTVKVKKRDNSQDGCKAHNDNRYIKVGRVRMNSWINKTLPAADIIISERQLVHISTSHSGELQKLGLTALNYVTSIINQCNHIRKDIKSGAYVFLIKTEPIEEKTILQCAVVELEIKLVNNERVYIIKTAHPENWKRLSILEFVCDNPRS